MRGGVTGGRVDLGETQPPTADPPGRLVPAAIRYPSPLRLAESRGELARLDGEVELAVISLEGPETAAMVPMHPETVVP